MEISLKSIFRNIDLHSWISEFKKKMLEMGLKKETPKTRENETNFHKEQAHEPMGTHLAGGSNLQIGAKHS